MRSPTRPAVTLLCVFLVIMAPFPWGGCGAPIDPGPVASLLSLSARTITPGAFITIQHPDILAGWPVDVRFTSEDYDLTYTANMTSNGSVRLPVPPMIDPATGGFAQGDVKVTLVGLDGEADLTIEAVPEAEVTTPGSATRIVLETALEDHRDLLAKLGDVEAEVGVSEDSMDAVEATQDVIDMLETMIDEYDMTGQMTLIGADGSTQTITAEELAMADQWLAAMFSGLSDELVTLGVNARGVRNAQGTNVNIEQKVRDGIEDVKRSLQTGFSGGSTLMSIVGLGVTLIGLKISSPFIVVVGAFAVVGGAVCSLGNAAVGGSNSDSFLNQEGDKFNTGQEALSQGVRYGANVASTIPGAPGLVATGVSVASGTWDTYNNGRNVQCVDNSQNQKSAPAQAGALTEFCEDSEPVVIDTLDGEWILYVEDVSACLTITGGMMVREEFPCGTLRLTTAVYPILRYGNEVTITWGATLSDSTPGELMLTGELQPGGQTIIGAMSATISSEVLPMTMTRQ